jgi:heterotetrameric sarcosine oxidase gamma subunit
MLSRVTQSSALVRVQSWTRRGLIIPQAAAEVLGTEWPLLAGTVAYGRADVICISPNDWLIVAGSGLAEDALAGCLAEALQDSSFRATTLSAALARIRLEGGEARALLSKACALDTQGADLRPGRAPRTLVAGLPVIVHCLTESSFELIVAGSYVDYVMRYLRDAAGELIT